MFDFKCGDKVKHIRTEKVGVVLGIMRGPEEYLVRFDDDQRWLKGRVLKREEEDGSDR